MKGELWYEAESVSERINGLDKRQIGSIIDKDDVGKVRFRLNNTAEGGDKVDIRTYVVNAKLEWRECAPTPQ